MKMRTYGKLGIQGSAFGLGCMRFTSIEKDGERVVDEEKAINIIRTAIDGGVTYMDTAYVYLGGQSEVILGKALQDGYREKVTIATKLPPDRVKEPGDEEKILAEELERLQTDHIDFYLLHGLNAEKWEYCKKMGLPEFLTRKKAEGVIRYACFSFHDSYDAFVKIIDEYDWDMCQIQYNFMDIENQAGTKGLEYAGKKGIPVVIMEGLLGGRLANAPKPVQDLYDAFPVNRSPVEWAERWLLNHPEIAVVLSGCTEVWQVRDNLRIFDSSEAGSMTEAELELIAKVRDTYNSLTKIGCTGCRYCMPCPNGVEIPRVFSTWNTLSMYGNKEDAKRQLEMMESRGSGPSSCLECGACEAQCPQELNIIESLKLAAAEIAG